MNFDAKLRRQSTDRDDLFHAHIGGMDTVARSLLVAAAMLGDGALEGPRTERYAGWDGDLGRRILAGEETLVTLDERTLGSGEPTRTSGRQEALENVVAKYVERTR
jgi:xylose isomerase